MSRRAFLRTAAAAAGAAVASRFARPAWAQPAGANGDVRLAVIGLNIKGALHLRDLAKLSGVRLAAICDVDPKIVAREQARLGAAQGRVFATTDARQILERAEVDAVLIATPNHWHALQTIWACQAGKDVYVEKPVCHTIAEGWAMTAAAAKYGRIVQSGTQLRSDAGQAEAVRYLRAGHLGKIQWIHALCYRRREPIGRRQPWYPDALDYNLYCGPAPIAPLERNQLHYDWHWHWDTGGGDLANIGVHQLDVARWFAGDPPFPRRVLALGGRFAFDDAGLTPNTALAVYEFPDFPVLFEIRGLPAKPGVNAMDALRGMREGVLVQCEGGYYTGYQGGMLYDNDGRRVRAFPGDGGGGHLANFIAAVRSRRAADLAAPLGVGRDSSVCCLAGNVSWRIGRPAARGEARRSVESIPVAAAAFDRMSAHLAVHGIDLDRTPLTLGRWLELGATDAAIAAVEGGDPAALERARFLRVGVHRPPFTLPAVA